MRIISAILLAASVAACTRNTVPADGAASADSTPPGAGSSLTQESDWQVIESLEAEAKKVAKVDGCATSGDCRTAPVGSRACGGPRYYIPYCAKTTDSAALFAKLDEVAKAERAYNAKYQIASTCEFRTPPAVESSAGRCVVKE